MSCKLTDGVTIPTIDLSAFVNERASGDQTTPDQLEAAHALVRSIHRFGFVKITGHGFSTQELDDALGWVKRLFALPYEEKMKAPHPPTAMPHRGYSGLGKEKVHDYKAMNKADGTQGAKEKQLCVIQNYKESYEVGSENDTVQPNIWLPDDVLPGFKPTMNALYERLGEVARMILSTIGIGLELNEDEMAALMQMQVDHNCQLRLVHYPPISKEMLEGQSWERLPVHNNWSAFTLDFQADQVGLEMKNPRSTQFLSADLEPGTVVFSIGDMLDRFTNGYLPSAVRRVSMPDASIVGEQGIPVGYSIPFFCAPDMRALVSTLPRFVTSERPGKYEPMRFEEYWPIASKYQYQEESPDVTAQV